MKISMKLALVVLAASMTMQAGVLVDVGTTIGGPTWKRPIENGTAPPIPPVSGVGTNVRYDVLSFAVDVSGLYSFQSTATSPTGWDNYTFLYQTYFNPSFPFANILIGNDDNPTIGLSGFSANLTAGVVYHFVVTGFGNGDAGAFSTQVSGPGEFNTAVPEPSTILLAGAALAALAVQRAKRG